MRSIDGEVPAIHPPNQAFRPRNVSGAIFCVRIIARQVKGDSKMGKNEKTKKPKPKYNVWQNTAYMLSVAWDTRRSVPLLVVLVGIPAGCIIGTLKVLVDRLKEIGKGEEDAYRNY